MFGGVRMENKDISITESFGKSISEKVLDVGTDTAEVVLDSFLDDEILKDIPIVKYAVAAYQIVDDIKGRFFLHKLVQFINSFNSGLASADNVEKQRAKFIEKRRDTELSYITIIVDRYLDFEKPNLLAKLYLAYLDRKLSWDEFCSYSEVIDKLLKCDLMFLINNDKCRTTNNVVPSELLRLTGVGLMNGYQNDSLFESDGHGGVAVFSSSFDRVNSKERIYERTDFGQKLVDIISAIEWKG